MPAFAQHLQVSSVLGAGYAAVWIHAGVGWSHGALAGALCAVSGMLPDLDSDSGKPTREVFGITAALGALLSLHRLRREGVEADAALLLAGAAYFVIRFGGAWLLKRLTVHRGMFHSLPAAGIAAGLAALAPDGSGPGGPWLLAGGVFLGYLSHLVLDDLFSPGVRGAAGRHSAAGPALKLISRSASATLLTWSLLGVLAYLIGVDRGYVPPLHLTLDFPGPSWTGK